MPRNFHYFLRENEMALIINFMKEKLRRQEVKKQERVLCVCVYVCMSLRSFGYENQEREIQQ